MKRYFFCSFVAGLVLLLSSSVVFSQPMKQGVLTGRIQLPDGTPLNRGIVSFFNITTGPPPDQAGVRRVPDRLGKLDDNGAFSLRLLTGKYYMGAMQWTPGRAPGPPRPGETFIFIRNADGALKTVSVSPAETVNAGVLSGNATTDISRQQSREFFTVQGTIRDEGGKTMDGVVVLVKNNLNMPRPLFISKPSGKDGAYHLLLPADKKFYLIARKEISVAGRPKPGSYLGIFGDDFDLQMGGMKFDTIPAFQVSGKKGDIADSTDITMFKIPDPEEQRLRIQKTTKAQQIEKTPPPNK